MRKKTPVEMEEYKIIKATRTLIRLKHSLNADEELNEVLPKTLDEFTKSLQSGELKQLASITIDEVLNAGNEKTS